MTIRLPEKGLIPITVGTDAYPTVTDTSGETVGAYLTPVGSTTAVLVGTASGAKPSNKITINLDLSTTGITADADYHLEIVSDVGGANPKLLIPNETVGIPLIVRVFGLKAY